MSFSSTYYTRYLHNTQVTFDNLQKSPAIKERIAEYGYDDNRITEGMDLYNDVLTLFRQHLEKRQERMAMGKQLRALFRQIFAEYMGHVKRLRIELKHQPEASAELALAGKRERRWAAFIEQALNFYRSAINDAGTAGIIQGLGFTAEKMQQGLDRIETYQNQRSDYEKLKGECQRLVAERDLLFLRLRQWMAAFTATCRLAFVDNLQTLEEIGIMVRNQPRSRTKGETDEQSEIPDISPPSEPAA
jgi:hypothetical protein